MKKIPILLALLIAALAIVSSCRKRPFPRPFEICHINKVTVVESGNPDTTVFNLSYDLRGLVTGIQYMSGPNAVTRTYSYLDTNIVVTTAGSGSTTTDSVTVNGDGLMLVDVNRSSSSSDYLTTFYYYSGTEVVNASLWYNGQPPGPGDYYEYTWSFGNLAIFTPQGGLTSTTSYSYTYNTTPAAMGDYFFIMQLLYAPAPTIKSTDQVTSIQQFMNTSNVTYSHLGDGRISGMTIITTSALPDEGNPDTVRYTYQYACGIPVL